MSAKEPNPAPRVRLTPAQQQLIVDSAAGLPPAKQDLMLARTLARLSTLVVARSCAPASVTDREVERAIVSAGEGLRQRLGATTP
jgi:hypothetical protein